jgi:hypothetical protein
MRSPRTTEDLLRTDRNEHQDTEVENWQGGARYISAVEMLPEIAKMCPVEVKNSVIIEIFKKFSVDSSKWVKTAAF